jgi:Trypsin/F5/8 type C domain
MRTTRRLAAAAVVAATGILALAMPAQAAIPGRPIYGFVAKVSMDGRACSGALVSDQWIVTAAGCFPENPQGGTPAKATTVLISGETVHVTTLVARTDRDLMLAKLDVPITHVGPVQLATTPAAVGESLSGDGFGRTATDWVTDIPHSRTFTVASTSDTTFAVTSDTGVDTCKGDAGGPEFRQVGSTLQLVGIHSTSWQHGCLGETETNAGSTEVRTDDIAAWISQNAPGVAQPDLALGKPVLSSSSYEADGWGAAGIDDGSTTSGWSSDSDTTQNHSEWIGVNLLSVIPLSRIDLYPRSDGSFTGAGFPVDFSVQVSSDGTNWTTVLSETGVPRPTTGTPLEFPLSGVYSAGFLRVLGTNLSTDPRGAYRMQLAELGVYAANLATGKPVTASSSQEVPSGGWSAAYATDGARSAVGGGTNGWTSASGAAGRSEWLQVDLGGPTSVSSVDLYPRSDIPDGSVGFPSTFTVEGSADGQTWTTLASGAGTPVAGGAARTFPFPSAGPRYMRVVGSGFKPDRFGAYDMQIGEMEIR